MEDTILANAGLRCRPESAKREDFREFEFDVLMAPPPFAGDIKESKMIQLYDLGNKENGKQQNKVGRDILFVERNLDFLRPGGRMAVVLPQGRFNNISDKRIRDFIAERARILAVVGLHGNTFKPHTGTKTSVLFVQKWNDDDSDPLYYCPKQENYPIFFAVSQKGGKDNSGDYVYVTDENGLRKLDGNGHLVIDHDLHNHDGELGEGIAEAFVAFAYEQYHPHPPASPSVATPYPNAPPAHQHPPYGRGRWESRFNPTNTALTHRPRPL